MFNIIIKRVRVIDGTGNPWFEADVGVKNGKIAVIGKTDAEAELLIDGTGLYVSPGFIDSHAHDDGCPFFDPAVINKLSQGVTTDISGNCGISLAPVSALHWQVNTLVSSFLNPPDCMQSFTTYESFLNTIEKKPLGINMGYLVGHGALRIAVMGLDSRQPSRQEMNRMKDYLIEALDSGALGLSAGLLYPPGSFAGRDEFIELGKVLKKYDAIFTVHIRDEAKNVVESVEEVIDIARQSGAFLNISHHKVIGKTNWGKVKDTLRMIDNANKSGIGVGFDQYPYTANSTTLSSILPPSCLVGDIHKIISNLRNPDFRESIRNAIFAHAEKWDNYVLTVGFDGMLVIKADATPDAVGQTIEQYANSIGKDPFDAALDLLIDNDMNVFSIYFSMSEADVEEVMKCPYGMVGTDGIYVRNREKTHPRVNASYPRILGRYVREKKILRLEEAVRKMTSLPAHRFRLKGKGLIKEGYDADLVIFDAEKILDEADYVKDCYAGNTGIKCVIVNGRLSLIDNKYVGAAAGKVIRRGSLEQDGGKEGAES